MRPFAIPRRLFRTTLAVGVLVVATGCGSAADEPEPAKGGDVPLTARALVAVAADHVDAEPTRARRIRPLDDLSKAAVTVDISYALRGKAEGNHLTVAVDPDPDPGIEGCGRSSDGCVEYAGGTLLWQEEEPEEDPGGIAFVLSKPRGAVIVLQSIESVLGDPRDLDLQVSVAEMAALARDARTDITTSAQAVEAGADLPYWTGRS